MSCLTRNWKLDDLCLCNFFFLFEYLYSILGCSISRYLFQKLTRVHSRPGFFYLVNTLLTSVFSIVSPLLCNSALQNLLANVIDPLVSTTILYFFDVAWPLILLFEYLNSMESTMQLLACDLFFLSLNLVFEKLKFRKSVFCL